MRILTISAISLLLFAFIISGCKKDKKEETSNPTPALTKSQMLTAKPWKLTALTVNPGMDIGGTIFTDLYAVFFPPCQQDDLYKFSSNNSYSFEEGASVCNVGDPQVYDTGTWTFINNETKIILASTGGGSTDTSNVLSISSTTVKLTSTEVNGGTTYTYTQTFTAQ